MTNLKKANLSQEKNLRPVFRFIDDLSALNDNDEFMRFRKDIHPPELELKVENKNNYSTCYLDIAVQLKEGSDENKLYDKTTAYEAYRK